LQGLRSEKKGYFPQPDLSKKGSSSFLGRCGAYLALSVKQRQKDGRGSDRQDQHPVLHCSAVSKGQAMREKVNSKGSQAGSRVVGKETGLIYEWRGKCFHSA